MVMRNKHDGISSHEWWDDLPPAIKKRVSSPAHDDEFDSEFDTSSAYRPSVVAELSGLAVIIVIAAAVVLACLLLLMSVSFLADPALKT